MYVIFGPLQIMRIMFMLKIGKVVLRLNLMDQLEEAGGGTSKSCT